MAEGNGKHSVIKLLLDLQTSMQRNLSDFKDLVGEFDLLSVECENYKTKLKNQKQKCENQICQSSVELQNIITAKDTIIQLAASELTKIKEQKHPFTLSALMRILCGDTEILTPPTDSPENVKREAPTSNMPIKTKASPSDESRDKSPVIDMSVEDERLNEESVSEIEGTPGRASSPILSSKTDRNFTAIISKDRDKKKCPSEWHTPMLNVPKRKKCAKLRAVQRQRQTRLPFRPTSLCRRESLIDLTCSPEFAGGTRGAGGAEEQKLIIKDAENDDTILPSPTSGPSDDFSETLKDKIKFKKPLSLKPKTEPIDISNNKMEENDLMELEESINILKPNTNYSRFPNLATKQSPTETKPDCDSNDASMSLLERVAKMESNNDTEIHTSPPRQPLAEDINYSNVSQRDTQASLSLLRADRATKAPVENKAKRKTPTPEKIMPLYKEPTVRNRAEKRALPAWCCDDCQRFFGELHKDDPEARAKAIDRCSKHRGRSNPVRPRTPPGLWNPRWHVSDDTEEFNRRNNAQ